MIFHPLPPNLNLIFLGFDLARRIFEKAATKYGSKLSHRQVDSIIRKSEFGNQVDKLTRKFLKALLINFERNGGDAV